MVINEFAYYKGKLWCAYELKDLQGNYKEDYRLEMRKESQRNMFRCPDCGEPLILCAGPIMEPFFKHYDNAECSTRTVTSSGRNMIARRILYHLIQRSFPEFNIEYSKNFLPKVTADFYIEDENQSLAVIYLSHEMKLDDWEKQHRFYKEHGITDVYFLNYKRYLHEVGTTFEYLISKADPVIKLLNYDDNCLIMKVKPRSGDTSRMISKTYSMAEVRINLSGNVVIEGFNEGVPLEHRMTEEFEGKEREERERQKEQDRLQSMLRKSKIEAEINKQEATKKRMESDNPILPSNRYGYSDGKKVSRSSMSIGTVTKNTMKMTAIEELWDLPELEGKDWQIRNGNMNRYNYIKNVNRELAKMQDTRKRQEMVMNAIEILERNTKAFQWGSKMGK
ncbi:MAG TPA: competence protein CoiA family protein [Lachnospiraceae bacterium]|nr:competence protein CoiA family protein [Lachnospiraceae bacterium]